MKIQHIEEDMEELELHYTSFWTKVKDVDLSTRSRQGQPQQLSTPNAPLPNKNRYKPVKSFIENQGTSFPWFMSTSMIISPLEIDALSNIQISRYQGCI